MFQRSFFGLSTLFTLKAPCAKIEVLTKIQHKEPLQ
uniref:Uncharacterized protein n=1 Tax=Siphoviridae sp. ctt5z12 TaxID=2823604 RepID=A0A8S5LBW1_9CAUD|nr:MAG TPA: hypothetical protein [Siphoviridae sp. ctt5z12]